MGDALKNPHVYRVTRELRMNADPFAKQRPSRSLVSTAVHPETSVPVRIKRFATETVVAQSVGQAEKFSYGRFPDDRVVSVEMCSDFDKRVFSQDVLEEVFAMAHENGYQAPTPEEFSEFDPTDPGQVARAVELVVRALDDTDTVPTLEASFEEDDDRIYDWVVLTVSDSFCEKAPLKGVSKEIAYFGDPDVVGWDGLIVVAQEVIDLAAPLT